MKPDTTANAVVREGVKRRSDWVVALAMLVGGSLAGAGVLFLTRATWGAILAGLLFWPGAFVGGCLATRGEQR